MNDSQNDAPGRRDPLRILGVDPGTRAVGWGVLEVEGNRYRLVDCGVIAPGGGMPLSARLERIHRGLEEVYRRHRPHEVATEEVFGGKSIRSAIRIGEGRGVVLLSAALHGCPVSEYAANQVKKAVVGRGGAAKQGVAEMVALLLGLPEPPSSTDATDALAIAITHAGRRAAALRTRRAELNQT